MKMPRLVATDLDGTALRSDGTLSPRTVAAFARVEETGAVLVLVTGRPPRWMWDVAAASGHRGLAVCANGALIYDLHSEQVVESHVIGVDVLREVVAQLRANVPDLTFSVEYEGGFAHESDFRSGSLDGATGSGLRVSGGTLTARPCVKLLAQHPSMAPDPLHELVDRLVGRLVTVTHSSRRALMEMSALGVTKATALARVARRYGVAPEEAVAFGDMPNDLPMLGWAGRSYAVANAHPDVLAAVGEVTSANDDDGVALVLENLYR
ncbi:HAD family hydrolase [Nonomuraea longicatena]|uniref:HAD family hydrolase n=1 Tax=Nonomuraea longicatena TaxID=83682 RepID=A0ABN1R7K8_9ACTN